METTGGRRGGGILKIFSLLWPGVECLFNDVFCLPYGRGSSHVVEILCFRIELLNS